MKISSHIKLLSLLIVIVVWLAFLFSHKIKNNQQNDKPSMNVLQTGTVTTGEIEIEEPIKQDPVIKEQIESNTERFQLQKLDVLAVKELFSSVSSLTTQFDTVEVMEYVYRQTKDEELLKTIIELLVQQYRFAQAYDYLKDYELTNYKIVDPHTALYVLLNSELVSVSNTSKIETIRATVTYYKQLNYISQDDARFYNAIISLIDNNVDQFVTLVKQLEDSKYQKFRQDIEESFERGLYRQDIPTYYLHALLALDVMEYGYFKVAQQVAIAVLLENDNYDLPYQMLAYSHFVMNNRDRAIEYLQILLDQENTTLQDNYKLLLGISYFRDKQYKNAILQLSQLSRSHSFRTDILRYQLASYLALGDKKSSVGVYQLLLGQPDIGFEDFYGYFENSLYKPLVEKEEPIVAASNEVLMSQYVEQCLTKLDPKEQYICEYGQAGKFLYEKNLIQATTILEGLAHKINKSYIFAALGDFYHREGEISQAQEMYTKAVALAVDERLKEGTKQKLLQLVTDQ